MRIIACRRSSGGEDVVAPSQTYAPADRLKLFAEADYVVCSLPGTAATQDFCGAQEFGAMKSTGVFVSLGRGAAVDEAALVDVLETGKIRGAALDVFKEEPLPPTSRPVSRVAFDVRRRGCRRRRVCTQVAALGPGRQNLDRGAQRTTEDTSTSAGPSSRTTTALPGAFQDAHRGKGAANFL